MTLATRPLGRSGLEITRVGLGSWVVGGSNWAFGAGAQDDHLSFATIRRAIDAGVNWIDTAPIYGLGHAEKIIGLLLRQLDAGERPFVFTKCGLIWNANDRMAPPRRVLTPASIRKECESSLRRLGVERIDLYQIHGPDPDTNLDDAWATMLGLVEEGKVRAAGVSNFDTDRLDRCESIAHVSSLQPPFSMINREAAARELPWCVTHGSGVLCYSPMQSGLLTDGYTADRVEQRGADDSRRLGSEFQQPKLARNLALRDALRPIARRHETSVSAVAIAWTLAWPGVTASVVGARTPAQVDGWIAAASLVLTADDLVEIAAAIERTGAGAGPVSAPVPLQSAP